MTLSTIKFGGEDKGVSIIIEIKNKIKIESAYGSAYSVLVVASPSQFVFSDGSSILHFDKDSITMMPVFSFNDYDARMTTTTKVGAPAIKSVYEQFIELYEGGQEIYYHGNKKSLVNTKTNWEEILEDNNNIGIDEVELIPMYHYRKYSGASTDIFPGEIFGMPKKGTIRIISQNLSPSSPWPNLSLHYVIEDMRNKNKGQNI